MIIAQFLGSMRPGHDGTTRVAYRMREGFCEFPSQKHLFFSPILPKHPDDDMRRIPSIPFPLSTDYRLSVCRTGSIKALLRKEKADIIHIHSPCTLGHAAVKAAVSLGIPTVATYHTHFPTYLKYYGVSHLQTLIWKYLRSLYGLCDAVIVPSRTTMQELEDHQFRNLVHIPHGVDTCRFSPRFRDETWREKVGGKNKVIVSFVGRLVWEKNLKLLAEAALQVESKDQVQFVIVGDGPARPGLQEMMPQAYFTGFLGDRDLPIAYASSDVFVFPSVTETFGNVTVEAMASGLPAICASAGGACDIVDEGINGLLVPPSQDPRALAEAIDLLVKNGDLRSKLSVGALSSVSKFQWDSTIARYYRLYAELKHHPKPGLRSLPFSFKKLRRREAITLGE